MLGAIPGIGEKNEQAASALLAATFFGNPIGARLTIRWSFLGTRTSTASGIGLLAVFSWLSRCTATISR